MTKLKAVDFMNEIHCLFGFEIFSAINGYHNILFSHLTDRSTHNRVWMSNKENTVNMFSVGKRGVSGTSSRTWYQSRGMRRTPSHHNGPLCWLRVGSFTLIPPACRDTDGSNEVSRAIIFRPRCRSKHKSKHAAEWSVRSDRKKSKCEGINCWFKTRSASERFPPWCQRFCSCRFS